MRPMQNTLGHDERLAGPEFHDTLLKVDEKASLDDKKEFVEIVVLVPVVIALDDPEPHDRFIHSTERLISCAANLALQGGEG